MHCDLWRSHGRIFAYMGRNFMSGICKSKPKNRKNLLFVKKKLGFYQPWFAL